MITLCFSNQYYYASAIALTGHPSSHTPQSMQTSASISYCSAPWLIAPTGQASAQLPQDTQSLLIVRAIVIYLLRNKIINKSWLLYT